MRLTYSTNSLIGTFTKSLRWPACFAMNKWIIFFGLVLVSTICRAQQVISGEIIGKPVINDSIYFRPTEINAKYYEQPELSAPLAGNKFTLPNRVTYPQLYSIIFKSDRNILAWRTGDYFIDPSTTAIKTTYDEEGCSDINNATAQEYQNKFIPFMTAGVPRNCKSNEAATLFFDSGRRADTLLLGYINKYPDSYVALWKLIERFSFNGQSALRKEILGRFSPKLKSKKVWKLLNEDFENAMLKENEKFPSVALKDLNLAAAKLELPKAKYILIDYWFARCRPCLDTIPELKQLYSAYKDKGFDIISISVDETANVPIWQRRVKEHGLTWPQYLEENNFRVNELGIKSFPTFILLDSTGKVVWRDFDLHDLDKFLKGHV